MKRWLVSGFATALFVVVLNGCYIQPIPIYQPYTYSSPYYYTYPSTGVYHQGGYSTGWRGYRFYPGGYRAPGWGWHGHGGWSWRR